MKFFIFFFSVVMYSCCRIRDGVFIWQNFQNQRHNFTRKLKILRCNFLQWESFDGLVNFKGFLINICINNFEIFDLYENMFLQNNGLTDETFFWFHVYESFYRNLHFFGIICIWVIPSKFSFFSWNYMYMSHSTENLTL